MTKQRTPLFPNRNKPILQGRTSMPAKAENRPATKKTVATSPSAAAPSKPGDQSKPNISKIETMDRGIGDQPNPVHYVVVKTTKLPTLVVIPLDAVMGQRCGSYFTNIGIVLCKDGIAAIRAFALETSPDDSTHAIQTIVGFNGSSFGFPFLEADVANPAPGGVLRRLLYLSHGDLFKDYRVLGSLEKWQELAKFAKGNSRLIFLLAAACAGPLSGLLGHLPMTFVLYGGQGGGGKSSLAAVASSMWGWNNDEFGFGQSCNGTPMGVQGFLASRRHGFAVLDEPATNEDPKKCAQLLMSTAFQSASGSGRVRQQQGSDGAGRVERTDPMQTVVVITSNATAAEIVGWTGSTVGSQHHDRMITIAAPADAEEGFFETLHGEPDVPALVGKMKAIAKANHGVAAKHFIPWLEEKLARMPKRFKQVVGKIEQEYLQACAEFAFDTGLARLNLSFARVYAAGVAGISAGVLNLTRKELLAAVLKCHRDCLPFRTITGTETVKALDPKIAMAKLSRFWKEHGQKLPKLRDGKFDENNPPPPDRAFISNEKSRQYLAMTNEHFVQLCGGKRPADALKAHLAAKGVLVKELAGNSNARNVVKRQIGAGLDGRFVLISEEAFDDSVVDFE